MKRAAAAVTITPASVAAASASARSDHRQHSGSAGYGTIAAGHGPASHWNEIEQSLGGNAN